MTPHGVDNYCCGGGSGFAIMSGHNFNDWRHQIAGRKKLEQILNAFEGELDPTAAFMTGKIKIDGDMGQAMKLSQLLG